MGFSWESVKTCCTFTHNLCWRYVHYDPTSSTWKSRGSLLVYTYLIRSNIIQELMVETFDMITRTRLLKGAQKIEFPQGVGITMPRLRNFHFTGDRYKVRVQGLREETLTCCMTGSASIACISGSCIAFACTWTIPCLRPVCRKHIAAVLHHTPKDKLTNWSEHNNLLREQVRNAGRYINGRYLVQVSYALSYSFMKNWIVPLLMSNPLQMCDLVLICIFRPSGTVPNFV